MPLSSRARWKVASFEEMAVLAFIMAATTEVVLVADFAILASFVPTSSILAAGAFAFIACAGYRAPGVFGTNFSFDRHRRLNGSSCSARVPGVNRLLTYSPPVTTAHLLRSDCSMTTHGSAMSVFVT